MLTVNYLVTSSEELDTCVFVNQYALIFMVSYTFLVFKRNW